MKMAGGKVILGVEKKSDFISAKQTRFWAFSEFAELLTDWFRLCSKDCNRIGIDSKL